MCGTVEPKWKEIYVSIRLYRNGSTRNYGESHV